MSAPNPFNFALAWLDRRIDARIRDAEAQASRRAFSEPWLPVEFSLPLAFSLSASCRRELEQRIAEHDGGSLAPQSSHKTQDLGLATQGEALGYSTRETSYPVSARAFPPAGRQCGGE